MNKDKMYEDMIEVLKDTLKEVCEKMTAWSITTDA